MQEIKCPNCYSGSVKSLTEEKYECLACGNVFLVHNLSKEFRKTDEHLTTMHEDLGHRLDHMADSIADNLAGNIAEIQNNAGTNGMASAEARKQMFLAEEKLQGGDFLGAYEAFHEYTFLCPDSAAGYEGMFRSLTDNYQDDAGKYKYVEGTLTQERMSQILMDGTDTLKKALTCKDCNKNSILEKFKGYYMRSLETLTRRSQFGNSNIVESSTGVPEGVEGRVKQENPGTSMADRLAQLQMELATVEKKIESYENKAKSAEEDIDRFDAMSEKDIRKQKRNFFFVFAAAAVISFFLWPHIHLFGKFVDVVVVLFLFLMFLGSGSRPDAVIVPEALKEEYEKKKQMVEALKAELEKGQQEEESAEEDSVDKKEDFSLEQLENMLVGAKPFHTADELYKHYKSMEEQGEKAFYKVWILDWGTPNNKKRFELEKAMREQGGLINLPKVIENPLYESPSPGVYAKLPLTVYFRYNLSSYASYKTAFGILSLVKEYGGVAQMELVDVNKTVLRKKLVSVNKKFETMNTGTRDELLKILAYYTNWSDEKIYSLITDFMENRAFELCGTEDVLQALREALIGPLHMNRFSRNLDDDPLTGSKIDILPLEK